MTASRLNPTNISVLQLQQAVSVFLNQNHDVDGEQDRRQRPAGGWDTRGKVGPSDSGASTMGSNALKTEHEHLNHLKSEAEQDSG